MPDHTQQPYRLIDIHVSKVKFNGESVPAIIFGF